MSDSEKKPEAAVPVAEESGAVSPETAETKAPDAAPVAEETKTTVEPTPPPAVAPATTGPSEIPIAAAPAPAEAAVGGKETTTTIGNEDTATKETSIKEPALEETPIAQLWAAARAINHPEIWGVTLADPETHVPTQIVLQKYLNANDGDLTKAKDQLTKTLEWRAKTKPLDLVKKQFAKTKFDGLGFVTTYVNEGESEPESKEVFTWNIYGGVKSIDETFGDLTLFLEWRVALMELALQELSLGSATKPITAAYDPYKIVQVHDYKSISFLRQSPHVKSASAETIKVFAQNYPELLKEKFFVNVPAIMGFVYAFMKLFVAPKTIKKFHPMSNGANLVHEFAESKVQDLGERLPKEYGGNGPGLKEQGLGPLLE